jgi:hypothetical protein
MFLGYFPRKSRTECENTTHLHPVLTLRPLASHPRFTYTFNEHKLLNVFAITTEMKYFCHKPAVPSRL